LRPGCRPLIAHPHCDLDLAVPRDVLLESGMVLLGDSARRVLTVASTGERGGVGCCSSASAICEPDREMHESDSDEQHQENDHRNDRECLTSFGRRHSPAPTV
jgi:hypothetical protein